MSGNQYVQGRDGKFAGSVGGGKSNVPTPSDTPAHPVPSPDSAVPSFDEMYAVYEQYRAALAAGQTVMQIPLPEPAVTPSPEPVQAVLDGTGSTQETSSVATTPVDDANSGLPSTYAERARVAAEAEALYDAKVQIREAALDRAGRRARMAGSCSACGHRGHAGGSCRETVQVMSDIWESCQCDGHTDPTPEEIAAAVASQEAYVAFNDMQEKATARDTITRGDRMIVSKGRKVPVGTTGAVLRTWEGEYGLRVLLRTDSGDEMWVAATNLDGNE